MSKKISIIIIDDHPLFRQGVADSISFENDMEIIGQASTGEEGLGLIRNLHPNVAIVDVNLPGLNGQQVTKKVIEERMPTRIVQLTAYDDLQQKVYAFRSGVAAYCTKDVSPDELLDTIRSVAKGHRVLNHQLANQQQVDNWLRDQYKFSAGISEELIETLNPLSDREMEVLSHVTRGLSNKEIARLLGISHQTVKNHVSAILRKLGVEDRTQAAIFSIQKGWFSLHQFSIAEE